MKKTKYMMAVLFAVFLLCGGTFVFAAEAGADQVVDADDPEEDGLIYVNDSLYTGYYLDSSGNMYLVSEGIQSLKSGTVEAGRTYYSEAAKTVMTFGKQTVFVNGKAYTGYYMDSTSKMYLVSNGTRSLKSGTVEAGRSYYSYNDERTMTLTKQTVFVNGVAYTGYYMDSTSKMYLVSAGTRSLKSGTVEAGRSYYSYNDEKTMTLAKQTVFVNGKAYTGYYVDSTERMYLVSNGIRSLKSGTVEAGKTYYSYNAEKTMTLAKQTVFVNGKAYTGYYMDSTGRMYLVSNGTRSLKSGTVEAGKTYYSYNAAKSLSLSKQTVFVNGKAYTGYYMDSTGRMYLVSNGTRSLKSGTVEAGKTYYSYNAAKSLSLSKQTVFVNGKAYTGYYTDSTNKMYSVKAGARTLINGTLNKGTSYYSYNDAKTRKLDANTIFVNGVWNSSWMQVNGIWCYVDATGKIKFQSDVLHTAWEKAQTMSSSTKYLIMVDTANTRTMIFQGSKGSWVPVYEWICSPGKPSTPTVKGEFTVTGKGYSFGSGYTCYYYTQFYGNYLFHSILYNQGTFKVQDGRLGQQVSHGCVRLSLENARWIYDNIPKNTKVYIY